MKWHSFMLLPILLLLSVDVNVAMPQLGFDERAVRLDPTYIDLSDATGDLRLYRNMALNRLMRKRASKMDADDFGADNGDWQSQHVSALWKTRVGK